jgi:hypothetical protein
LSSAVDRHGDEVAEKAAGEHSRLAVVNRDERRERRGGDGGESVDGPRPRQKRNSHTSGSRISAEGHPLLNKAITPSFIVKYLDQYVIGQDDAKKTVAVTVYSHFKKIAKSQQDGTPITKSNVLLIGPSERARRSCAKPCRRF